MKGQDMGEAARQEGTSVSKDRSKRTRKILSKKERENLVKSLKEVDPMVLTTVTNSKLCEQSYFSEMLTNLVDCLFADNHKLAKDIITNHQAQFGVIYIKCKQEVDPYIICKSSCNGNNTAAHSC